MKNMRCLMRDVIIALSLFLIEKYSATEVKFTCSHFNMLWQPCKPTETEHRIFALSNKFSSASV